MPHPSRAPRLALAARRAEARVTLLLIASSILFGLSGGVALAESPVSTRAVGDGVTTAIQVQNLGLHPEQIGVGPTPEAGISLTLEGYTTTSVLVQCAEGSVGGAPPMWVTARGRPERVEVPPVAFEDGAPTLWISSANSGRARLAALLKPWGHRVVHLGLSEVPETFSALRFAPWVLIELSDLEALKPPQRRALQRAVAAGTTLVVALGEGAPTAEGLGAFSPVSLGGSGRPGPALRVALPQAVGVRAIKVGEGAHVRLTADGEPLVVESFLGLGRVRVIGVRAKAITEGPATDVLFESPPEPLAHVLRWLSSRAPLSGAPSPALGWWTWALLGALPLVAFGGLRLPRLAAALGGVTWLGACLVPPTGAVAELERAEALFIPFGRGEALAVGIMDVRVNQGGGLTLPIPEGLSTSLEEARPVGACLTRSAGEDRWMTIAEPGDRRRLVFFSVGPAPTSASEASGAPLPTWPPGPIAGAGLAPLSLSGADGALPLPVTAGADLSVEGARIEGWRVMPAPLEAPPAEALVAPGPEGPG